MTVVKQLHESIFELERYLDNQNIAREVKIKGINEYLDKHESLIASLPNDKTEEEKKLLNEILDIGPKIDGKLKEIRTNIKKDLVRVKNTKKFSEQSTLRSKDGTFFDKKL